MSLAEAQAQEQAIQQQIADQQAALRAATNANQRIIAIRKTAILATQLQVARRTRQLASLAERGAPEAQIQRFAETSQANIRAGVVQEQQAKRGVTPVNVQNLEAQFKRGQITQEQLDRQRALGERQQQALGAQQSRFPAREASFARTTPSGFRQIKGLTQTLVEAKPEPFVALTPLFAGRAAAEAKGGISVEKRPIIEQTGETFRPFGSPVGVGRITTRPEFEIQIGQPEQQYALSFGEASKGTILSSGFSEKLQPLLEAEKRILTPEEQKIFLGTKTTLKEALTPKIKSIAKEFGGEIRPTIIGERLESVTQIGIPFTTKKIKVSSFILKPLQKLIIFEETKIAPKLERFFEITPEQLAESKRKRELAFKEGRISALDLKASNIGEQLFTGLARFESRPLTKVLPVVATGAAFVLAEEAALFGITKVPAALEFFTSPAGKITRKGLKAGFLGLFVLGETAKVVTSPKPFVTAGEVLGEVPTFFAGARAAGGVFETPFVRESFVGSPSRRIVEVEKIKGLTEEKRVEAIRLAKEEQARTGKVLVSPETEAKTTIQIQTELREASDVVAKLRGKVISPDVKLTPEYLRENLKEKISLSKARRIIRTLEQYSPDLLLKGSITQGTRKFGDIDTGIRDRLKGVFEVSAGKTTEATGVKFDIITFTEARQTSTAQIEKPTKRFILPSGERVFGTGIVEQASRKVEGAIRFFGLEEGGVSRGKDLPDVVALRKDIERIRSEELARGRKVDVRKEDIQRRFGMRRSERRLVERMESSVERELRKSFEGRPSKVSRPSKLQPSFQRVAKSFVPAKSFNKSFSKSFSFKPSPSVKPSSSIKPSSILPSPSPSVPRLSKFPSSITSKSVSQSFSRSFSGSSSSSFSYNYFFERPPSSVGKPKIPLGLSEFGFGRPQRKRKLPSKFTPSLIGITRNLRFKGKKLPKVVSGLGIRRIPISLKPISFIEVLR